MTPDPGPDLRTASLGPAPGRIACAHCGLDVPRGLIDPAAALQFCCSGCRTVHEVIHGSGLERFYGLRDRQRSEAAPSRPTGRRFVEMDDPAFLEAFTAPVAAGVRSVELYLEGVHCAACLWLVERLPRVEPAVLEARRDLRRSRVRITWIEEAASLSQVARALDSLGYPPHPARDARSREGRRREDRRYLVRIAAAGAGAGNVMLLAFALYGGAHGDVEAQYGALFRWVSLAIGLATLAWPGDIFFRGAWAAIRTRTAHLDLPIAPGLGVGAVAGSSSRSRSGTFS